MLKSPQNMSWPFYGDHVHNYACYDGVFTDTEIQAIIDHAKLYELEKAKLENNNEETSVRDNEIVFIGPQGIEWLFSRLTQACHEMNDKFFRFDIFGLAEGLQFTQYTAPRQHYKIHMDKLFQRNVRKLSIVVQLTDEDEYEGGDLELILGAGDDTVKMPRKKGKLIMFPSYIIHQVTPITKGQRHSLVGWITGKPFT
jgi:PKHD-type hydroxylase